MISLIISIFVCIPLYITYPQRLLFGKISFFLGIRFGEQTFNRAIFGRDCLVMLTQKKYPLNPKPKKFSLSSSFVFWREDFWSWEDVSTDIAHSRSNSFAVYYENLPNILLFWPIGLIFFTKTETRKEVPVQYVSRQKKKHLQYVHYFFMYYHNSICISQKEKKNPNMY